MAADRLYKFENYAVNILDKLNRGRILKSESCDIIISVEDVEFSADKNILSASSTFFRTMFTTNMKEKYENKVVLKEISSDVFFHILNFIYTGEISLSIDNVSDFLHAASMMQIGDLLNTISTFFEDDLSEKNCLRLRDIARKYSIEKLVDETTKCIIDNFDVISEQKGFNELSFADIDMFIFSNDLMVKFRAAHLPKPNLEFAFLVWILSEVTSEENVYTAIVNWIKSDNSRIQYLGQLFKNVRLKFISSDFLVNTIMAESMIDDNKDCRVLIFEALKHHSKPDSKWICEKRKGYGNINKWNNSFLNDNNLLTMMSMNNQLIQFFNIKTEKKSSVQMYANWNTGNACEVVLYKNSLVVFGNNNQVVKYDGSWSLLPNLSQQRYTCLALVYKDGLLVYGSTTQPNTSYATSHINQTSSAAPIHKLNETDTAWITYCNMNVRPYMKAVCVKGTIYCIGGQVIFKHPNGYSSYQATNIVSSFNLETKKEMALAPMNQVRTDFFVTSVDSTIYVVGGTGTNGTFCNQIEFLIIEDNVWTNVTFPLPCDGFILDIIGDLSDILILIKTGYVLRYCPQIQQFKQVFENADLAQGQQLTYGKFVKGGHDLLNLKAM